VSRPLLHTSLSGVRVATRLAGGVLLAVSGLFSTLVFGVDRQTPDGARATKSTKHNNHSRAPIQFDCPHWPHCACPGGTVRPECPGLAKPDPS
jgi:hypothetical protein